MIFHSYVSLPEGTTSLASLKIEFDTLAWLAAPFFFAVFQWDAAVGRPVVLDHPLVAPFDLACFARNLHLRLKINGNKQHLTTGYIIEGPTLQSMLQASTVADADAHFPWQPPFWGSGAECWLEQPTTNKLPSSASEIPPIYPRLSNFQTSTQSQTPSIKTDLSLSFNVIPEISSQLSSELPSGNLT